MTASGAKSVPTLGFFTVVENDEWGITGGLLVLNTAGRPLEFHCTAPLKPNRAQEILYGATLRPFLYSEQIGQTLLSKVKSDTMFVCTDVEPALGVREFVNLPVVLLCGAAGGDGASATPFPAKPGVASASPRLKEFTIGKQGAAVLAEHSSDENLVLERWQHFVDRVDLQEPFGRIRDALAEAQRGATK